MANGAVSIDDKLLKKLNKGTTTFFDAVAETVKEVSKDVVTEDLVNEIREAVKKDLIEIYGVVPKKVELAIEDRKVVFDEPLHKLFDTALAYLKTGHNLYLHGPTGCGKTYLCAQLAKAMGLDFYFTECVTAEHKLEGFTDANGQYHETPFFKAFTRGGLFLLDELDASIPETLVILSMALANGCYSFPAPIGNMYAHPDFHVIAAGNTNGHGATTEYNSRQKIDSAMLNKFSFLEVDYDHDLEKAVAEDDPMLLEFVEVMRQSASENGINLIISYRNIKNIHELENVVGLEQAIKGELVKCLSHDDMVMLYRTARDKYAKKHNGLWPENVPDEEKNRFMLTFKKIAEFRN